MVGFENIKNFWKNRKNLVFVERFLKKIIFPKNTDECFEWNAGKDRDGYGQFHIHNNKQIKSHRFSYRLVNGKFDEKLVICHSCDNPGCVNPNHLFKGTQIDNIKDRHNKNRDAFGNKNGSIRHPERLVRGSNHHKSKITEDDVLNIRKIYRNKMSTQRNLAKKYKVSISTIGRIIHMDAWTHV